MTLGIHIYVPMYLHTALQKLNSDEVLCLRSDQMHFKGKEHSPFYRAKRIAYNVKTNNFVLASYRSHLDD